MKIKDYIQQDIIQPRLEKEEVLVVYDAHGHYRELCADLASDTVTVVNASTDSITSRELAVKTLQDLGKRTGSKKRLLVYVPKGPPLTNRDKMSDPFSVFGAIGDIFPRTGGDELEQLCLRAKSDHATEIRKVFAEHVTPSFDLIDNIGSGAGWPALRAVLGVDSTREIVVALMAPNESQLVKLQSDKSWIAEAAGLVQRSLGIGLKTQIKEYAPIRGELWRSVLFSEFFFDLPTALPSSLTSIPKAIPEAAQLVYSVCDSLRTNTLTQSTYIEMALHVEEELNLKANCDSIYDLGIRDTFPFEERSFFSQCLKAIEQEDVDASRAILARNTHSVWMGSGESQMQWSILSSIVNLIEACSDASRELGSHTSSQEKLIFYYVSQFYKVDLRHREFEQAVYANFDFETQLEPAIARARKTYAEIAALVQKAFVKHLETTGWPPSGMLSSTEIFDKLVAPSLVESGNRVAYFLIDALRYELGTELEEELADEGTTSLQTAFSFIPTVTPIGMTSLLPSASSQLRLVKKGNDVVPMMGDTEIKTVEHRMSWIKSKYGGRFQEAKLTDVIQPSFKNKLGENVELLVIRSSSMDGRMETDYEFGLPSIVGDLRRIRVAIRRLQELGFKLAVIATDHGFFINPTPDIADTCPKPNGNWKTLHDRSLLGDGTADAHNWVLPTEQLGIRGDFAQIAGPRSLACYSAGNKYFHGGASFQEALVPVISVKLSQETPQADNVKFSLTYKRGSNRITTKLPVVDVSATQLDLFLNQTHYDLMIQAVAPNGTVVGEPKTGGLVNAATGILSVSIGNPCKVTMRMSMEYEGKFTIRLLDPTTLVEHDRLELETDYVV